MNLLDVSQRFTVSDSLLTSVIGMLVVFCVLVFIMVVIYIMSLFFKKGKKSEQPAPAPAAAAPAQPEAPALSGEPARGSCGGIKLHGVPDRTAAMLMAITADQIGAPLNELHFKSIKEIKENR